jgi:hypothetical protein
MPLQFFDDIANKTHDDRLPAGGEIVNPICCEGFADAGWHQHRSAELRFGQFAEFILSAPIWRSALHFHHGYMAVLYGRQLMPAAAPVENAPDHCLDLAAKVNRDSTKFRFARRPDIRFNLKLRPDTFSGSFLFDANSEFNHGYAPLLVPQPAFIPALENGKIQNSPLPATRLN